MKNSYLIKIIVKI